MKHAALLCLASCCVLWSAPALPCLSPAGDVVAFEVRDAPRGGVWWLRGTRTAGDSFVLVAPSGDGDGDGDGDVVVVPTVVSTGGLTTWAIAVPDFPVGTAFRLRGFTPEGADAPSDVVLTISDVALADEGSLALAQPRVTLSRALGSVESGFVLHNPLELIAGDSCSSWPPLLWMGTTTGESQLDVAFTIDTPELVVLDVGRGDLDEPITMQLNAFPADGDVRLRFSLDDDQRDDVHVRVRSIATGVAGDQVVVPLPATGVDEPRFRMSVFGCAQSEASPPMTLWLAVALLARRRFTRRSRASRAVAH